MYIYRGTRYGRLGGGTSEISRNLVGCRLVEQLDLSTDCLGMSMF